MMKRFLLCLLALLCLCLSAAVPAFAADTLVDLSEAEAAPVAAAPAAEPETLDYVTDLTGLLSAGAKQTLEAEAERLAEQYDCGVYIIVLDDYRRVAPTVEEATVTLYNFYSLGAGDGHDALLLLMSMAERDYDLWGKGPFAEYAFTDYALDQAEESFLPYFGRNDWAGGFRAYQSAAERALEAAAQGEPLEYRMPLSLKSAIALGPSALVAFLVTGGMKAKMKTAKEKETADEYVVRGSAKLRVREDQFINRTRTVHVIESSSGGGRGGGSFGGGTSHHSGKF